MQIKQTLYKAHGCLLFLSMSIISPYMRQLNRMISRLDKLKGLDNVTGLSLYLKHKHIDQRIRFQYLLHMYPLTLLRPMEFSLKFDTIKSGWSFVFIRGSKVIISKKNIALKIDFVLARSADPDEMPPDVAFQDEMPPYAAFHLGLHCLPKYPFKIIRSPSMLTYPEGEKA